MRGGREKSYDPELENDLMVVMIFHVNDISLWLVFFGAKLGRGCGRDGQRGTWEEEEDNGFVRL